MKLKSLLYTILFTAAVLFSHAQTVGQGFKYQTAIRDQAGIMMANKLVGLKMSILQGNANGSEIYVETHKVSTSDFGIANLSIGAGTLVSGNFANIDWGNGPYFLKVELDLNNTNTYLFMGTSQLLAVPFALYAAKSANAENDYDKDSLNEVQQLTLNNQQLQLSKNGGAINLETYKDNTDSQKLSLQGNTLSISGGNSLLINDNDSLNELQSISLDNNQIQLSKNGGSANLSKYLDNTDSQNLILQGTNLSISGGNTITLSGVVDLDSDPTNELQILALVDDTLKLTKGNFVLLPKDYDRDSLNEIQSISVKNNKLYLSKADTVNIDGDTLNEIQSLVQTGNSITLSKGGGQVEAVKPSAVQNGGLIFATATGTNNLSLSLSPPISQYTAGMMVNFRAPSNNTGSITININNLGQKNLFKNITDSLQKDEIKSGQFYSIIYDGNNFQLLSNPTIPKYKISNYYMPGELDRIVDTVYNSATSYIVPQDSILIYIGGNINTISIGSTLYPISNERATNFNPSNIFKILAIPSGSNVNFSAGHSNFIISKAYVTPIFVGTINSTFIVPSGKYFCLLSDNYQGYSCTVWINGSNFLPWKYYTIPLILPSGSTITFSNPSNCTGLYINGYLFDK
jgi:hypothetical protein